MINRYNNLELIRLFLALQVLVVHVFYHILDIHLSFLEFFPGVPAFFFLSGFLIYGSYQTTNDLFKYFRNRFLRLFPALFVVCTISSLWIYFYRYNMGFLDNDFIFSWTLLQISIGQAYNPPELRDFGVGVINGSLWTITVEIIFYFMVPFISYFIKKFRFSLFFITFLSFIFYSYSEYFLSFDLFLGRTLYDFLKLTPLYWGWMFFLGIYFYIYFEYLEKYFKYFIFAFIPLFLLLSFGVDGPFFNSTGNQLGLFYFIFYVMIIIFIAFKLKPMNINCDLSYSVYIIHMPLVNVFMVYNINNVFLLFFIVFLFSLFSWFYIEKPSLKLKDNGFFRSSN